MKFPVAVQLFSVRDEVKKDFRGTLEKVKEMGYDGVEFAGLQGNEAADIKKMCDEIGLVPISAHVSFGDLLADTQGTVAKFASIGCKYITIPHIGKEFLPGGEMWDTTAENIRKIGAECRKQGVKLLYHNHDFEFVRVGEDYSLDVLYNTVSEDLLATELDTCWVKVGGEDPAYYIRKYSGRAPVVHLKDFVGSKTEDMYELIGVDKKAAKSAVFELRPVGYGCQDFYNMLKACEDAGTEWIVVEQDSPSMEKTPIESIELSRNYLKTLGN